MEILPVILFGVLFAFAIFGPLRWSIVAYIMLSTVDFYSGDSGIGYMNAMKGIGCPVVLLWRLKHFAGHGRVIVAPVAWMLLIVYAGIASFWSLFPLSAAKLTVEMLGSFLICLAFMRATKGGYLTPSSILIPATIGVLAIGVTRSIFLPSWGDSPYRFTGFTTAQGYASLLAALFSLALGARTLRASWRWLLCVTLFIAVILDGSRIYVMGLILSMVVALLVSYSRPWLKILGVSFIVLIMVGLVAEKELLLRMISQGARLNRVADTINAVMEGNLRSTGLGTYEFRRGLYQRAVKAIAVDSSLLELAFGHGTSNGRLLRGALARGIGDPNRAVHNEWLRILYEWGGVGLGLWFVFVFSITLYAYQGVRKDRLGHARPLLIFLPAFLAGFSTENILAGAGHAENIGFVLVAALAAVSHRKRILYLPAPMPIPYVPSGPAPRAAHVRPYFVPSSARRQAL
jgi:O-Antigen ligase